MATAMRKAGHDVDRDQVARLMGIVGIEGVRRGKHRIVTTTRDPKAARHPDLIKRAWGTPSRPDVWWVADFTYVWTIEGFVYTSFVTDVCSRRVPRLEDLRVEDHTVGDVRPRAGAVHPPAHRRPLHFQGAGVPLRHRVAAHRDRLHRSLIEAGIAPSIGTVGDALDNALMESTIGLYKTELVEHDRARNCGRAEVERDTASWAHWYYTTRIHHSIAKMSPIEFEEQHRLAHPPTRTRLPKPSLHQTQGDSKSGPLLWSACRVQRETMLAYAGWPEDDSPLARLLDTADDLLGEVTSALRSIMWSAAGQTSHAIATPG